jgi:hypothetical protein
MTEEFLVAQDLDLAWSNFDPFFTLPAGCPFHVEPEDKPLDRLKRALLRQHRQPPKYFFSGHRGCGKSTELNRLAADDEIKERFFIVKYSVKDVCDVNNLDYIDVLFSIGAQLYIQYLEAGGKLESGLIKELDGWKNSIIEKEAAASTSAEVSIESGIKAFFISFLAKIKSEDSTRKTIRQKIEPKLSELIDKINMLIADIEGKEKKKILVLIDDLDKPRLDQAKIIFFNNYTAITQPSCFIVYTVPISIYFTSEFTVLKESKFFLPNVKLHSKNDKTSRDKIGYELMRLFVSNRMKTELIEPDALNHAIKIGAGVFRESARVMQIAIDRAIEKGRKNIINEDVDWAESELRGDFKRQLTTDDYIILKEICDKNEMRGIERIENLLHNLSVLEYVNGEPWCDVHPVIEKLLKK